MTERVGNIYLKENLYDETNYAVMENGDHQRSASLEQISSTKSQQHSDAISKTSSTSVKQGHRKLVRSSNVDNEILRCKGERLSSSLPNSFENSCSISENNFEPEPREMHKQSRMLANSKSGSDSLKTESSVSPTDSNILELSSDFPNNSSLSSGASFEHLKPLNNPGTGAIKSMLANSTHIFCSLGQSFCQEQPQGICKLPSYNSSDDPGSLSTNSERSRTAEQKGRKKRFICTVKPRNDAMRAIGKF